MLDQSLAEFLFALREPFVVGFCILISKFGGAVGVTLLTIVLSFTLKFQKKITAACGLILAVVGSTLSMTLIKYLVGRPRPIGLAAVNEDFSSFPSGHATAAMALYGYVIYLVWQANFSRGQKILLTTLLSLLILLIGFSRLYLGVHFLTDVLAGFALGAAWVWIAVKIARSER
jgi:undecaprenyl-diphosphatase